MSLQDKIEQSTSVLRQVLGEYGPESVAVAWTAGKDSTLVLWLWRCVLLERGLGPFLAVNLDTGLKFPEIIALRDDLVHKWGVQLLVQTPEVDLSRYPVAHDKLECCKDLKILPLHRALTRLELGVLLTGLRRDEHPDRVGRHTREVRQNPDHVQVNPILDWTEMDVWAYTLDQELPYCPLYDRGYRSLGCMPCTRTVEMLDGGERGGRDQDKELQMERLRSLGYF